MDIQSGLRARPGQDHGWTDESDIAVALIRGAFLIVFSLLPYALGLRLEPDLFTQLVIAAAAIFELGLLVSYLRRWPLLLKRPLALALDLLMVTAAVRFFESLPMPQFGDELYQLDWLAALYYPVIMVGAIWFQWWGAIPVAVLANVLYVIVGRQLSWDTPLLWVGHGPAMLMIAVAASYIVMARDRERRHADRLENELALARRLQDHMLPDTVPEVPGLELGLCFRPARAVGGDLYDVAVLDGPRLLLCLGDMAGKSVYGLVHLSLVHSHLRAAARQGLEPAEIAEVVNANVYDALQPDSYAALFIAAYNPALRALTFANCGHLPPILLRAAAQGAEGEVTELVSGGIVVGAMREPRYQQQVLELARGDLIVLFTDGIAEARSRRREEFGLARIVHAVKHSPDAPAAEIALAIVQATEVFSPNAGADDRTVLVARVLGDGDPATPDRRVAWVFGM